MTLSPHPSPTRELVAQALIWAATEGIHPTPLAGLKVIRSNQATFPDASCYPPSLCLVLQGAKELTINGQILRFDVAHFLVVSVDLPVTSRVLEASPDRPFLCLAMELDPGPIFDLLQEFQASAGMHPRGTPGLHLDPAQPELMASFLRLLCSLNDPADCQVLAPLAQKEILYRLLKSPCGESIRQLGTAGSPTQRIARAIEKLRTSFHQPLRVETLAQLVNMSPSAFHQYFRRVTTMSPLQYQKELRLQEARRLLHTEGLDAASAAFQVGYESPSHFSREYARLFGLPPIQERQQARQREEARLAPESQGHPVGSA